MSLSEILAGVKKKTSENFKLFMTELKRIKYVYIRLRKALSN